MSPGYLLKVLSPAGGTRESFPLGPGIHVVGSAPGADVRLEDASVSRRHAELRVLEGGGLVVADLGSKNGTFLGERRIREAALTGLSPLVFGSVQAFVQPVASSRLEVLLAPPGAPAVFSPVAVEAPTTLESHPMARLAAALAEILPLAISGLLPAEEAAAELVARWVEDLPLDRAEILRHGAVTAVTAAASRSGRLPHPEPGQEIEGPAGWSALLRPLPGAPLARLEPLFKLALAVLAARSGTRRAPHRETPAPVPLEAPAEPPSGLGAAMRKLYRQVGKVARGQVSILVLGESGVGKERMAHFVHAGSPRAGRPFLAVNCAALPRELLEAELFGIEKGVATGVEARPGLLERGSGGTVFLDEVGDMAPEIQAKVLRILENPTLYRLGGRHPIEIDVRFVAATNRDLLERVEEGTFRRDLYHRLAAFEVTLPPLRERREEIPALSARFLHRETGKGTGSSPGITRAALGALVAYPWPGNVRELQNEIAKAALLLEPGEALDLGHLSPRIVEPETPGAAPPLSLDEAVHRAEREAFAVALAAASGDAPRAMELLGISRTTYYRKLKELGIEAD